ncbi:hypothetical protein BU16DRAFT_545542 [Lophium mytilinum]|uniref:Uncharacterized protein n=1 Tax=Lophium mytilinum TaxID=390894 RepID=A0A6A6Q7H9_9PEZI|nr:hypothetical protein BU16DRAFT_545542 [Lophium mytilinum]
MLSYHLRSLVVCSFIFLETVLAVIAPGYTTDLKFALNPITRTGPTKDQIQFILYTTVLEYEADTSTFSLEQIAGIAQQAWAELPIVHAQWANSCSGKQKKFITNNIPNMISAIAIGKEIYISSTAKRNEPNVLLENDDQTLTRALAACRAEYFPDASDEVNSNLHRTHGNCGEIMASALYLQRNNKFPWDADLTGTQLRIVAYGSKSNSIQPPCDGVNNDDVKRIGCHEWTDWKNMEVVGQDVVPEKVTVSPTAYHVVPLNAAWKIQTGDELDPINPV